MADTKNRTSRWVGIDVSKSTFDASLHPVLQPGQAKPSLGDLPKAKFKRTESGVDEFLCWLDRTGDGPAGTRAVMEATGRYSTELALMLIRKRGDLAPAIVNPRNTCNFARSLNVKNKNDRLDAAVLARYGAERFPAPWAPKAPEYGELQELVRQRAFLVKSLTESRNRLTELTEFPDIAKLQKTVVARMEKTLEKAEEMIRQLIAGHAMLNRDVNLLTSIPGVGFVTTATVLGEIGDLRAFRTSRRLSSFAGLSPVQRTSGTSVNGKTRMSKMGSPEVRRVLYMAAVSIYGKDNDLADFGRQLVENGKNKMQALGAMMRKLLVLMRAVLISGVEYRNGFLGKNPNHAA